MTQSACDSIAGQLSLLPDVLIAPLKGPSLHQKIFISYSRADSEFAKRLDHDLDNAGFNSFLDQNDIPPGVPWDDAIQKALVASTTVVVVLSPESVASGNVLDEIGYALRADKRVIPVRLKPCETPLRINRIQYADFTVSYDAGLTQLITALKGEVTLPIRVEPGQLATPKPPVPPPAPPPKQEQPVQPPAPPRTQSNNSRVLWIAVLVALALVVAGILIWRSVHTEPPVTSTTPTDTGTTTSASSGTSATQGTTETTPSGTTGTTSTASSTTATTTPAKPEVRPRPPQRPFVCDEDRLPVCCRDSFDPAECRKCKKKLDIPDRCD